MKYANQVILDFTGRTDYGVADLASLTFSSFGSNSSYYSGIVVADEPTDYMTVHQTLPTGNGAETAWTGDYTAVDETGVNDTDFIQATAADQVETFTFSQLGSEWAAYEIKAVTVGMRAVGGVATPTVEGVARIDGVNYAQAAQLPTPATFGAVQAVFETNPADDSAWTRDVINAAQFGVKAVA
ncbi:hypothetical protein ACFOHY_17475 [Rhizobium rosettiformans]|uniref:hypothetical protein n=1 Tax=Rhizobium rosettiformans TaxID=1368430 RepID=UPI00361EC924